MAEVKAIETCYNGYRFRSRLEARWAVFFDRAGIPFEYETEGYVLPDGSCYLPDFYLPWFKAFVEIKRESIYFDEEELAKKKLEMLFDSTNIDCIAILCIGDPAEQKMNVLCNYYDSYGEDKGWFRGWFYEGAWYRNRKDIPGNDEEITNSEEYGYSKHWITLNCETPSDAFCKTNHQTDHNIECLERMTRYRNDFETEALDARQARFEHGESGYCGR